MRRFRRRRNGAMGRDRKALATGLYTELHAVDGEDLVELFGLVAPGGVLYVHNVSVFATQQLFIIGATLPRLDMLNSRFTYAGDTLPALSFRHTGDVAHRIVNCYFEFLHTRPLRLIGRDDDVE